jgi:hypothetical protein
LCLGAWASAGERAFLETETARATYFVQEPIRLKLRVGFDVRFFEANVVQLFRQELDVPVHVQAPWLEELAGTTLRKHQGRTPTRLSLALNDAVVMVAQGEDRLREGRRYTVLEIARTYLPTRPGDLVVPAPRLRFAYGTEFKEDFVHGRVALDRRYADVDGTPLKLTVRALPAEGRPPEFSGAVGRDLAVHTDATPRTLEAGAICKLVLRVEGEGNLELFETPRLDGLAGDFHVYGMIDDRGATRRTITYDLAPLDAAVKEVPSLAFAYFDTRAPAGYRTLRTRPIPLAVRPGSVRGETPPPTPAPRGGFPALRVAALVAALLAATGLLLWRRARRRGARDAARDAAAACRAQLGQAGADPAAALAAFLAAHLRCPTAAVITPNLQPRLTAAGVPAALAARTAALLEQLVAARYGAAASDDSAIAAARALVDELEVTFRTTESTR